jgi:hypothetical protein
MGVTFLTGFCDILIKIKSGNFPEKREELSHPSDIVVSVGEEAEKTGPPGPFHLSCLFNGGH